LAITSTDAMVRRLGFVRWKRLHRAAYVAAGLAILHFLLRVKADFSRPILYGSILGFLFGVRIFDALRKRKPQRPRPAT